MPLGRRFRALKLWWVLRSYGATGLRHHVGEHIALAGEIGLRIDKHPRLSASRRSFALVCFRHCDGNAATDAVVAAIKRAAGPLRHAVADGETRFVRIVGQTRTTGDDVERLWNVIAQAA